MTHHDSDTAMINDVPDRRQRRSNATVVKNFSVQPTWHVEIDADKHS
jgi:hypothetical protein